MFAGGFGVRELGKPAKVDADTQFMIASNTKALTTLMLAKLVDEKKLDLGHAGRRAAARRSSSATPTPRSKVLVKHLICACTGLPRQDMEWLFEFEGVTPDGAMRDARRRCSRRASSASCSSTRTRSPRRPASSAATSPYPEARARRRLRRGDADAVFDPLGMKATTFDFAQGADAATPPSPHAPRRRRQDRRSRWARSTTSIDPGAPRRRRVEHRRATCSSTCRWSSPRASCPTASATSRKDALLARRAPQVAIGKDATYGMGLDGRTQRYGVTVVHHGGDMIGFHSDMMWLPEHGVGAVILTNGDPRLAASAALFRRKLLEVLFDGKPEADADVAASAQDASTTELAAERKLLTVPADPAEAGKLAARYANAALGEIAVRAHGRRRPVFDFGEWKSEVASRKNPDGTVSFVTIAPGHQRPRVRRRHAATSAR